MGDENELMLELSIGGIFAKANPNLAESIDRQIDYSKYGGIQANRRRKREEKMKKKVEYYGSCGSVSGPFVENKEWRKKNIKRNNEDEIEGGGGRCYCKMKSDVCVSLAYSDGHCSSHQGDASDDSRSNSCNSQLDHQPTSTSTSVEPSNQHQPTGSIKPTLSTTKPSQPISKPEPNSQHQQAALLDRMPCVSTTGNGPNGKTVSGFLYRYTKQEVSIVCVCHGHSFSPAGFVEHAGGVDVANPLKHITIFPAAFSS
ncbi:hypothetical protein M8C21_030743 [Ambrosia artemisiifolia]|uniref:Ninja-family protein n=1 Tax=Ambrosia artemisiifolia TaxID=4212 RepID=A0AAD5CW66_AMBAR|nr:hypothetical protein M8C21_030743 [Ambrosia artemisiifolia]